MSEPTPDPMRDDPAVLLDPGPLPGTSAGRGVVIVLLVLLTVAVAGAVATSMYANSLSAQLTSTQRQLRSLNNPQMQVPTQVQQFRLRPEITKPTRPSLTLEWRQSPQLLDVLVDLSESTATQYQLTLERSDGVRVLQLHHVTRDANKDLHFSLNSSAFGRGDYLLRIDSYDWQGRATELGWLRLSLQ